MESSPRLEDPQQQLNKDERAAFQLTVYYCKCDTLCLCIFNGNDVISVINTCNFMDSCLHGFLIMKSNTSSVYTIAWWWTVKLNGGDWVKPFG